MKDAISGMGLYIIVILFIALFATYVSVTTTYSRCFRIKDELVTLIEHYRGANEDCLKQINSFLIGIGYAATGDCPGDGKNWNRYNTNGKSAGYGTSTNYCIAKIVNTSKSHKSGHVNTGVGMYDSSHYQVVVFFKLEWPFIRNLFIINIAGETRVITNPQDNLVETY